MINTVEKQYDNFENQFVSYKLVCLDGTIKSVPLDTANKDYQAIQQWISEGNTVIDNGN